MRSFKIYTIDTERNGIHVGFARKQRINAARKSLRDGVWHAYHAIAKLDSLAAWQDCKTAENWNGEDALVFRIGEYEITATASRRFAS